MENVIMITFDVEAQAYQAFSQLKNDSVNSAYTILQMAVIKNEDGKTVAAADMLVPGIGELIGGSQREENYDKLVARMDELGMDKTNYEWYLNLRKFGGVEHAGYGLGFERMIMYLTGIQNIRDVLPFPRTAYGF